MKGLNALQQAVLDKMVSGDHPALAVLRTQAEEARLASRESTGVGFFCDFEVPPDIPRLKGSFHIGDVNGNLDGLQHGAGFVLFVRSGRLDSLEGFSYDEPWPEDVSAFSLTYSDPARAEVLTKIEEACASGPPD